MTFKTCSACNIEKPATREHFARDNSRKDHLSSTCKVCKAKNRGTKKGEAYYYIQEGPPLSRAFYEDRIVDGRLVQVREVRST